METNFEENKKKIISKLIEKVKDLECPICHKTNFEFGGGYFAHDLQDDLKSRKLGGVNIPTVPLVCKNCGYLLEFAAGTLDLLPKSEKEESKSEKENKDKLE